MKKVLIDKNDYTSRQKVLFKTKQKPLSLQNGYKIVPTFDIPEIDLGVSLDKSSIFPLHVLSLSIYSVSVYRKVISSL